MAVAHRDVCTNWRAAVEDGEDIRPSRLRGTNVNAEGDRIFSYGWWEMARLVRTRGGAPSFWLLNGDSYSSSTSGHQSNVRGALSSSNLPKIIVPYTALDSAGIAKDSIRPLEIRDDRYEPWERSSTTRPEYAREDEESGQLTIYVGGNVHDYAEIHFDGELYTWTDFRHVLGDSLFTASVTESRHRPATEAEIAGYTARIAWGDAFTQSGMGYDDFVREHGEAPDHANVQHRQRDGEDTYTVYETRERRAKFLSSFDYQEARPLYFLCEMPRGNAQTVEQAYEELKPPAVKAAMDSGLTVTRQGDIFAIPTSVTTRELKSRAKTHEHRFWDGGPLHEVQHVAIRKRTTHGESATNLLGTRHCATEVVLTTDGQTYARGLLYHATGGWSRADHARRKMLDGRTWHRILKNTVPGLTRNGWTPIGVASHDRSQATSRAFTIGGGVD